MSKDLYDRDLPPPHPGEILREDILPRIGLTLGELAGHLGVSAALLADFLAERASVTADLAMRLGAALGHGARYWLGLQMQHDLWIAATSEGPRVKRVVWQRRAA
jgi:addiction module HigA family antidote